MASWGFRVFYGGGVEDLGWKFLLACKGAKIRRFRVERFGVRAFGSFGRRRGLLDSRGSYSSEFFSDRRASWVWGLDSRGLRGLGRNYYSCYCYYCYY